MSDLGTHMSMNRENVVSPITTRDVGSRKKASVRRPIILNGVASQSPAPHENDPAHGMEQSRPCGAL
jgi:hypothetical protein